MSEAKDNYSGGDKLQASDVNQNAENTNDGGAFRDDINAGETINGGTLPVAVFQQAGDLEIASITQTTENSSVAVYDSNLQIGQNFQAEDENISKIDLILQEVGSPSGNLNLNIYAVDGSGFPTGASLGSVTINANTISGKGTYTFTFATPIDVVVGTTYVMVLSFPGGDVSNHVLWYFNNTSVYANGFGVRSTNAGSTWLTLGAGAYDCAFTLYAQLDDAELYACDADNINKINFSGFAISNSTDGNPISFQGSGIVRGFSGLSKGKKYYIQDDKTIGTSPDTYEVLVGVAISETELLIQKGNRYASGVQAIANSTATYTITTGFRVSKVSIQGIAYTGSAYGDSSGGWTKAGSNDCIYKTNAGAGTQATAYRNGTDAVYLQGVVSNVTDTSFDIVNTKVSTGYADVYLFWEAIGDL